MIISVGSSEKALSTVVGDGSILPTYKPFALMKYGNFVGPGTPSTPPVIPLAACASSWVSQTHPGSSAGGQRAKFNNDFASPFYVIAGGSGSAGSIAWSIDGITWTLGSTNASQYVMCLAYDPFNDRWIAGGWNNSIENSTDGKTFTTRTHSESGNKNGLACNTSGRCCMVSDQTGSYYIGITDDGGDTWYNSNLVLGVTSIFRAIATDDNGIWLASKGPAIYKSTNNGIDWVLVASLPAGGIDRDMVWASGLGLWVFTIDTYIYTSPDGITWIERFNGNLTGWTVVYRIAYSTGGCLVAVGNGDKAVQSIDAITWTPIIDGLTLGHGGITVSFDKWLATNATELYTGTP